MPKLPTIEEILAAQQALEPYYAALGRVAHSWNHMQEQFGRLFCLISGLDNSMGMAIWHTLKSDRNQRDILKASVLAADEYEDWRERFPKAKDDILWLIKKVDALADRRNSAIHAPITCNAKGEPEVTPLVFFGNPNARKLLGACPNSRCSILSESDSSLSYEQVFSALEYRSDTAAAAECAGLRAERPCLAVYR